METKIKTEQYNESFYTKWTLSKWDKKLVVKSMIEDASLEDIYYGITLVKKWVFMKHKPEWLKEKLKAIYKIIK
jgi:hypothetical protein